jgi:hypothetical protein
MVAKFNFKTQLQKTFFVFESFRLRLTSKFAKSANIIKNTFFFKKAIWESRNTVFETDFESVEKVEKNMRKKL